MPAYTLTFEKLQLEAWDPTTMTDDCCALMVGARHSGKSVLITDLMYHKRKRLDMTIGMNPTEEANSTMSQFTPSNLIFDYFNNEVIEDIITWQKAKFAKEKPHKNDPGFVSRMRKIGLVLDDCMTEKCVEAGSKRQKTVMESNIIEKVFKLGRHYKLFFICAMQYIKDAPPKIRGNVDYVFAFDTSSVSEKEKLWKEYFGMFTYPDFLKVFKTAVGEKYNCLVLDTRKAKGAKTPGTGVYYYKAPDRTSKTGAQAFRVGRRVFWDLADYYYKPDASIELDADKIRARRMGTTDDGDGCAPAPLLKARARKAEKKELVVSRKPLRGEEGADSDFDGGDTPGALERDRNPYQDRDERGYDRHRRDTEGDEWGGEEGDRAHARREREPTRFAEDEWL